MVTENTYPVECYIVICILSSIWGEYPIYIGQYVFIHYLLFYDTFEGHTS